MAQPIVVINNLTKSFKIPLEASSGIKQKLINLLKGRKGYRVFTPLKDIDFTINEGDFFGIVGRNGSGKSTLLKTIAGIYTPNSGSVEVGGSLVPFIELGDFMEERLKNYSSGMQVRLAFSIAIRAHADILLLDEVLAVGDEAFQKKCYAYFDKLKREKRTVILVTHDMSAVERFCNKAVFIEDGKVKMIGKPYRIAAAYSRSNIKSYNESEGLDEQISDDFDITLRGSDGNEQTVYEYNETMTVELEWQQTGVKHVGVAIFRENGEYVYGPNTYQEKVKIAGKNRATYTVQLNLNEGSYFIKAGLMGADDTKTIAFTEEGPHFSVQRDYDHGRWGGVTKLKHTWK